MLYGTAAALGALLLTAVLTGLVRRVALRAGVVDHAADRSGRSGRSGRSRRTGGRGLDAPSTRPTPRLGGVAVVVGALLACGVAAGAGPGAGVGAGAGAGAGAGTGLTTLLVAALAVALLGLVHDLRPLRARPRLAVEAAAAVAVVYGSGLPPVAAVLAVVWIVLVTRAFSGLDHADGVASVVGVVTALGLALCAAAEGLGDLALVLSVLAAALTGFLVHNWHPARITLGDCGARFAGFLLASGAVLVHVGHPATSSAAALFALAAVAVADAALVLLSRRSPQSVRPSQSVRSPQSAQSRRHARQGGGDHSAHRLRRLGLTAQGAAVVLAVVAAAGTVTGLLVHRGTLGPVAVLPLAGGLLLAVGGLLSVPAYGPAGPAGSPRTVRTRALGPPGRPGSPGPSGTPRPPRPADPVSSTWSRVAAPRSARPARTDRRTPPARTAPRPSGVRLPLPLPLPLPGNRARRRAEGPRSAADLAGDAR
ncbi:MraY family glycosyltransferase [Streptomyces sp. O3]